LFVQSVTCSLRAVEAYERALAEEERSFVACHI
jgi:hypothetical protein